MAFSQPARPAFELPISDLQAGDTILKQKAVFQQLRHEQDNDGYCVVYIGLRIDLYASVNGEYGERLSGRGINSYGATLTAANDTLVDAQTGQVLGVQAAGETAEAWRARIDELSQTADTLLQGDFFRLLRDNGLPGTIRQLIEHHIQQADALGRFQ